MQLKHLCKQLKGVQWLHLTGKKQCIVDELYYAALNVLSQPLNNFSKKASGISRQASILHLDYNSRNPNYSNAQRLKIKTVH